ncbi:MAG: hypothetical protein RPT25_04500 [Cycloclasticus sp.]|jgi:hypothetical protein
MKINAPLPSLYSSNKLKKTDKKRKSGLLKSQIDSELRVTKTIPVEDELQMLIAKYVEKIAAQKFGKFSDSNILATAIQIVSSKLKQNDDAVSKIKKLTKKH